MGSGARFWHQPAAADRGGLGSGPRGGRCRRGVATRGSGTNSGAAAGAPGSVRKAEVNSPRESNSAKPDGGHHRHQGRDHFPASIPDRFPDTYPATIAADPDPLVSSSLMMPIVNGWGVESHHQITQVVAGLASDDRSGTKGRFAIARQRARPYSQTLDLVDVPGAGALKITHAPLGPEVVNRAQRRGNLQFVGSRGVRGTLHLKDDTVTLQSAG